MINPSTLPAMACSSVDKLITGLILARCNASQSILTSMIYHGCKISVDYLDSLAFLHRLTYVFEIDEGIADTKQSDSTIEGQLVHRKTYLQLLAKSKQGLESAKRDGQSVRSSTYRFADT